MGNKWCDTSHHSPLSNDKTLTTRDECQDRCEEVDACRFFLWREDDCQCATFRFCGRTTAHDDEDGTSAEDKSYIYKRHWILPEDEDGEANGDYVNTYETNWYQGGEVNDKYCCNFNLGKKCSRNVLILDTEGEGANLHALWGSEDNCKSSCASDMTCNFYMYRWDGSLRSCATFRTCKNKNRKNYGNPGTSCVYKKDSGAD